MLAKETNTPFDDKGWIFEIKWDGYRAISEIKKDKIHYRLNTAKKRKPKYLLSYSNLFDGKDSLYYKSHYKLLNEFRIENHLQSDNKILEKIYKLKPSGTDYNLYEKIKN